MAHKRLAILVAVGLGMVPVPTQAATPHTSPNGRLHSAAWVISCPPPCPPGTARCPKRDCFYVFRPSGTSRPRR